MACRAAEVLCREHRTIEAMLELLEAGARCLDRGDPPPPGLFVDALDFMTNFTETRHHVKEETLVFPLLEDVEHRLREIGHETTLDCLAAQHDAGRAGLLELGEAIDRWRRHRTRAAAARLAATIRTYVEVVQDHVRFEERHLVPMLERGLTPAEDERLAERLETAQPADETWQPHRYEEMVAGYRRRLKVGGPRQSSG